MAAAMVPVPAAPELFEYLGVADPGADAIALAYAVLDVAIQSARGHTRGRGFDDQADTVAEDIAAAILTASARAYTNPRGTRRETIGSYDVTHGDGGWTMHEMFALNRWRQRVA